MWVIMATNELITNKLTLISAYSSIYNISGRNKYHLHRTKTILSCF
jgi:hypothetical protein